MLAPVHVTMAQGETSGLGHLLIWSSLLHNPCKGSIEVRADSLVTCALPRDRLSLGLHALPCVCHLCLEKQ